MTRTKLVALCLVLLSAQLRAQQTASATSEAVKSSPPSAAPATNATPAPAEKPPKVATPSDAPPTPPSLDLQKAEVPKAAPVRGYTFQVGESTLKLGGYVKVDLIHDFDRIGDADSFDPRTIDVTGLDGENTVLQARETRLNLDMRTPTDMGELKTYIEGDFFGTGNSFRLRHAYGQVGHVLGGQTWSTFMDEDAMPSTLDFESPIAFPLARLAQVRYTEKFGDEGSYFAVALEDPNNAIVPPTGVPGTTQNPVPDLAARVRLKNDRGHVQLGLFGGMASFQPDAGSADDVPLWGLNLSAKETTWDQDFAVVQLTYGDGVGAYRGGTTALPDADGDLEAVETTAWMAAYQHYWSEKYRSTVSYSSGRGDLPSGSPPDTNEVLTYLSANVIWQFCDRAWVGLEYLHGTRETFDGSDGEADRLQFSMRFDL
jgi:hypothetical protein